MVRSDNKDRRVHITGIVQFKPILSTSAVRLPSCISWYKYKLINTKKAIGHSTSWGEISANLNMLFHFYCDKVPDKEARTYYYKDASTHPVVKTQVQNLGVFLNYENYDNMILISTKKERNQFLLYREMNKYSCVCAHARGCVREK
jgi:hypothetical protein